MTPRRTKIVATVVGNRISMETDSTEPLNLWLCDELIDLDLPIEVIWNGKRVHQRIVPRRISSMLEGLLAHNDPKRISTAQLKVAPTSND